MSNDEFNDPQYDIDTRSHIIYNGFDRFKGFMPDWVWNSLMGVSPQKRRSFLLQQKFRTPLTFDHVVLDVYLKASIWAVSLILIRYVFWKLFIIPNLLIAASVSILSLILFLAHKRAQSSNSSLIEDEITFQRVSDFSAFVLAIIFVFNDLMV